MPLDVEKPSIGTEKSPKASLQQDDSDLVPFDVEKPSIGTEKVEARFARIQSQILARQDIISHYGHLESYWKTYRGKRLGPYYKVVFWDAGRRKSIYFGRNEDLAKWVRELLARLQHEHRQRTYLRQLRNKIRRALRHEKAKLGEMLAPRGFRMKGYAFHLCRAKASNPVPPSISSMSADGSGTAAASEAKVPPI